ncbi:hypothetical protein JNK13_05205 [bacterium]|nr:hypothetical protein [bacterium]
MALKSGNLFLAFNALCALADTWAQLTSAERLRLDMEVKALTGYPNLATLLRAASLFDVSEEMNVDAFAPSREKLGQTMVEFHQPYRVCAFDDGFKVILVAEKATNFGLYEERLVIHLHTLRSQESGCKRCGDVEQAEGIKLFREEATSGTRDKDVVYFEIFAARAELDSAGGHCVAKIRRISAGRFYKKSKTIELDRTETLLLSADKIVCQEKEADTLVFNILVGLIEGIMDQGSLIFSITPQRLLDRSRLNKPSKIVPRADSRTIYRAASARWVHDLLNQDKQSRNGCATVKPHTRRGHWRFYSNPCFVNKCGKRDWIAPVWVGKREAQIDDMRIKVHLDV